VLNAVAAALSGGTQPALPGFLNSLAGPLGDYGVWAIALLVLLEDFGIPVPGETVLIAGAVYAGSGRLNIVEVGIVGFVAAVVGDNIGYAIGRFGGRRVVDRYGKYVFLTSERLDKAERFFDRQGGKIITIARFSEGLRQANGIIAGITAMPWRKFLLYNALGAFLWVGWWTTIAYVLGTHLVEIIDHAHRYKWWACAAIVVAIGLYAWFHIRHIRRRRAREAAGSEVVDSRP